MSVNIICINILYYILLCLHLYLDCIIIVLLFSILCGSYVMLYGNHIDAD